MLSLYPILPYSCVVFKPQNSRKGYVILVCIIKRLQQNGNHMFANCALIVTYTNLHTFGTRAFHVLSAPCVTRWLLLLYPSLIYLRDKFIDELHAIDS